MSRFDYEECYLKFNGEVFAIAENKKNAKVIGETLIKLFDENKQLKQELKEFKDYVFSDEGILCYSCVNCISKGIYEVECSEKGKVDVHSSCFSYWKNELEK